MKERLKKVNELIKEEVAKHLSEEVNDPELGLVTVTEVDTSPDLRNADVWVSFISEDPEKSLELINDSKRKIQAMVNQSLTMKFSPHLNFKLDKSAEKVERLNELLQNEEKRN